MGNTRTETESMESGPWAAPLFLKRNGSSPDGNCYAQ
jgi:hypothetical protein